jgi:hypothetical protein
VKDEEEMKISNLITSNKCFEEIIFLLLSMPKISSSCLGTVLKKQPYYCRERIIGWS